MSQLSNSDTCLPEAETYIPTANDQAEFAAWCESVDAGHEPQPEPTAAEWAAHVETYLADHNLAEVPF